MWLFNREGEGEEERERKGGCSNLLFMQDQSVQGEKKGCKMFTSSFFLSRCRPLAAKVHFFSTVFLTKLQTRV